MCVKVFKYWPQPRLPELRLECWGESAQYVLKLAECKLIQSPCHGVDGFHGIRGYMESIHINGHPWNSRRRKMMPGTTQSRRHKVDDTKRCPAKYLLIETLPVNFPIQPTSESHNDNAPTTEASPTWNKCVLLPECGNTRMWENQPSV